MKEPGRLSEMSKIWTAGSVVVGHFAHRQVLLSHAPAFGVASDSFDFVSLSLLKDTLSIGRFFGRQSFLADDHVYAWTISNLCPLVHWTLDTQTQ